MEDISGILLAHEGPIILEVELLLVHIVMVVFVDVKFDRILLLNITSNWINAIGIFVSVAVEDDLLGVGYAKSEVLGAFSIKFKQILVKID